MPSPIDGRDSFFSSSIDEIWGLINGHIALNVKKSRFKKAEIWRLAENCHACKTWQLRNGKLMVKAKNCLHVTTVNLHYTVYPKNIFKILIYSIILFINSQYYLAAKYSVFGQITINSKYGSKVEIYLAFTSWFSCPFRTSSATFFRRIFHFSVWHFVTV